ncbi:hypothetical protein C8Q80DRAFT_1264474 [Daedaleopsis nitida]|nr:hypothetical protein C8Q80DRAFT_1264474 [Daedaleopsis nitida]
MLGGLSLLRQSFASIAFCQAPAKPPPSNPECLIRGWPWRGAAGSGATTANTLISTLGSLVTMDTCLSSSSLTESVDTGVAIVAFGSSSELWAEQRAAAPSN